MAIINLFDSVNGTPLEGAAAFGAENELRETRTNDAVIKPGRLCTRDASDRKVKLPTTVAEVLAARGVTELTDTQKLNTSGEYPVGTRLSVVRKGVVYMKSVAACVEGAQVFCYYGAGDTTLRGRVSGTYVDGENTLLPGARFFQTQAVADSMAAVEFDLPGDAGRDASFGSGTGYVDVVVDLGAMAAGPSINEQSTAVTGALAGDVFAVTSLTTPIAAGVEILGNARCRVDGTVVWELLCTTGTPNPASNTFRFSLVSRQ